MVLDIMRREKKLLLSLLLVPLIFGLVAYLVPGMPGGVWGGAMGGSALAKVGGSEITPQQFTSAYQRFLKASQYPYDRQFLKTLQIDRQILNQLISKDALVEDAKRLGIDATSSEIQQRVWALPYFKDNGNFVFSRYEAILKQNGLTAQQFEEDIRAEIIQDKLKNLITDWVTVTEKEVEDEFRAKNEKVKVSYITFDPSLYSKQVTLQDSEIKSYYEQNKETFRIPEQRKVKYLFIDTASIRSSIQITDEDVKNYYQQNLSTYQLPERVRAAHILFKTEGKSPEEVEKIKAKALEVHAQAKKGANFAELAKKNSEDSNASTGGDLGMFGRGAMVPEFEKAAFSLDVGGISELVKTQYGFHIIKLQEKQTAHTQSLEEVASLIRPTLQQRKAEQAAQEIADKAYSLTRNNKSLDQVAVELKLKTEETPFFVQGATVPVIGNSQDFSSKVFALKPNEVGSPVRIPSGFAICQLSGTKAPSIPPIEEVHGKIESALKTEKAAEIAKTKAQEFSNKAKGSGGFEALAKEFAVTPKVSDEFARGGNVKELGSISPFEGFAFSANPGEINQPVQLGQKYVVIKLLEKKPVDMNEFPKMKEQLRQTLIGPKKDKIFQAYTESVNEKMRQSGKIKIDEAQFAAITRRI
ncbi:MAG: peptidyl-prolyl cis-trans isomerase [Terriglobia bacterium]